MRPNACHAASPFLFWAIISAACRKSLLYSHMLDSLAQPLTDLAFLSPTTAQEPIFGIQASLIILTWALPRLVSGVDTRYTLAALALHRSEQAGFHRPNASREYQGAAGENTRLAQSELLARENIWRRCVYTYQSIAIARGQVPRRMPIVVDSWRRAPSMDLSFRLQSRSQDLVVQCCTAVEEYGLYEDMSASQCDAISSIIGIFIAQLGDVESEALPRPAANSPSSRSELCLSDRLSVLSARLQLQVFYLFLDTSKDMRRLGVSLSALLSTACAVYDSINTIISLPQFPPSPPSYIIQALITASLVIIRLVKTAARQSPDYAAPGYVSGCERLASQLSTSPNDKMARLSAMLGDLWRSETSFKNNDGSPDGRIRVLSRLGAGLQVDTVWRWMRLGAKCGRSVTAHAGMFTSLEDRDTGLRRISVCVPAAISGGHPKDDMQLSIAPVQPSLAAEPGQEDLWSFLNDEAFADLGWLWEM